MNLALSAAVRAWREFRKMTRDELALAALVFPDDVENLEALFERDPQSIVRIAKALGLKARLP